VGGRGRRLGVVKLIDVMDVVRLDVTDVAVTMSAVTMSAVTMRAVVIQLSVFNRPLKREMDKVDRGRKKERETES